MDQYPGIVRIPLRLLLCILSFGGKLLLGLALLLLGMFGIAILAAYPQLPPHEQRVVLWGVGIVVSVMIAGSMAWLWLLLKAAVAHHSRPREVMTESAWDSDSANRRIAGQVVTTVLRQLLKR